MSNFVWIGIKTINDKKIITGAGDEYKLVGANTTHPERAKISQNVFELYETKNPTQWGVFIDYDTVVLEDSIVFEEHYLKSTGEKVEQIFTKDIDLYTTVKVVIQDGDVISGFNDETQEWEFSERGLYFYKEEKKKELTALIQDVFTNCYIALTDLPIEQLTNITGLTVEQNTAILQSLDIPVENGVTTLKMLQNIEEVRKVLQNKNTLETFPYYVKGLQLSENIKLNFGILNIRIQIAKDFLSEIETFTQEKRVYTDYMTDAIDACTNAIEVENINLEETVNLISEFTAERLTLSVNWENGMLIKKMYEI